MKLDLETDLSNQNHIRHYEQGKIVVNNTTIDSPFIIFPDKIIRNWSVENPENITLDDLSPILEEKPEILLIGSGKSIIYPHNKVIAEVQALNIGLEVMDTGAACRCFNLLVSEKRFVAAVIFT